MAEIIKMDRTSKKINKTKSGHKVNDIFFYHVIEFYVVEILSPSKIKGKNHDISITQPEFVEVYERKVTYL